jgi:UDP-N-acetylmuramoyl-L-alanyl-D-glutamate--2,6-diaminopimelate ligase
MMRVACELADVVIATADNSRHESIENIFKDMKEGIVEIASVIFEPIRETAISIALNQGGVDDIVLIAGKGHEDYQIFGDEKRDYSDKKVVLAFYGK